MQLDLNSLDLNQLKKLRNNVDKAIETYSQRAKEQARKELEMRAKELGFTLVELTQLKSKRPPVLAKYKNPYNSKETWTGRGRKPKWVSNHLDDGGTLDDLAI